MTRTLREIALTACCLALLILMLCAIRAAIEPGEYEGPVTFEEFWKGSK